MPRDRCKLGCLSKSLVDFRHFYACVVFVLDLKIRLLANRANRTYLLGERKA